MKRIHLFEFEDLSWFPSLFRGFITDLLEFQLRNFEVYNPILPKLQEIIQKTNSNKIIDLCSGSSGPLLQIYNHLYTKDNKPIPIILTDKYPNKKIFERAKEQSSGQINFIDKPVDATCVDSELFGLRTLFTSFHHFQPETAKIIIRDAVDKGVPIGIFEFTERTPTNILKVLFFGILLVLINTPFIRPFRWNRIICTYLIPIVPLVYTWDALVSHLRTYSIKELLDIVTELGDNNYFWEISQIKSLKSGFNITYVIGYKKN